MVGHDDRTAPVFAMDPSREVGLLTCVWSFRPVLHEAAIAAAPARISAPRGERLRNFFLDAGVMN
jgi:hypothetical protein